MPEETRDAGTSINTIPHVTVRDLAEDPQPRDRAAPGRGRGGPGPTPASPARPEERTRAGGPLPRRRARRACRSLGETELSYLDSLSNEARSVAARGFFSLGLSCVVVTGGHEPPRALHDGGGGDEHAALRDRRAVEPHHQRAARRPRRPARAADAAPRRARRRVRRGHPAPRQERHRQERVRARARPAWAPPGRRRRRALRLAAAGLGLRAAGGAPAPPHRDPRPRRARHLRALFGITAVRDRKRIDLVVQLCEWNDHEEFDRLGVEERTTSILGTPIRELRVPVRPGRRHGQHHRDGRAQRAPAARRAPHGARVPRRSSRGSSSTPPALEAEDDRLDSPGPTEAEPTPHKPSWSTLMPQASRHGELGVDPGGPAPKGGTRSERSSGPRPTVVVVSGLSGAGKSQALHALEDLGFFCVDNLPTVARASGRRAVRARRHDAAGAGHRRAGPRVPRRGRAACCELLEAGGPAGSAICTCSSSTRATRRLLHRFSETRRPHPLSAESRRSRRGRARRARRRPRRARAAGAAARARDARHRHDQHQRPRAAAHPHRALRPCVGRRAADGHAHRLFRLQVRHAGGRRRGARRALPRQPLLRARAEAPHRAWTKPSRATCSPPPRRRSSCSERARFSNT